MSSEVRWIRGRRPRVAGERLTGGGRWRLTRGLHAATSPPRGEVKRSGLVPLPGHPEENMSPAMTSRLVRLAFVSLWCCLGAAGFAHAVDTPRRVTTPKEHLGFALGDDYCLANYQQLAGYWAML